MYQLPVTKLETIRKSRKKVKRILSDIGLEYCKELSEEFKSHNPGEYYMKNTSWADFSTWQPSKKSKTYRAKPYCCSLCDFSTKFISAYKSHMRCSHEDEMDVEMMVSCPNCTFISHPKTMKKHVKIFHSDPRKVHSIANHVNTDQIRQMQPKVLQGKMSNLVQPVYFCKVCSYKDISLYAIKKHVFLSHFGNSYIGQVEDQVLSVYKYFCKGCQMKMVTYDALLYHILDKHKEVDGPVKATVGHITELRPRLPIAPKPQVSKASLPVPPSVRSTVSPPNSRLTGHVLSCVTSMASALASNVRPIGPVLSCVKSTANISPPVPATPCVRSPVTASVQQTVNVLALPQNIKPVTLGSLRPNMNAFHLQNNVIPVTVSTTGPGGAPKSAHVNLVPATFQVSQNNLTIRAVGSVLPQAFLMSQELTMDHTGRTNIPGNVLSASSQTVRHLIQSNKHVNGLPAYTLTPVQFSLPVTPGSITGNKSGMITTQMPLNIAQTNAITSVSQQMKGSSPVITVASAAVGQKQSAPVPAVAVELTAQSTKAQQWKSCSVCSALLPLSAYDNHVATAHKVEESSDKAEKIVACATYLQRVRAHISKCLFCRSYVDKNILISHLLMHGLTCMFCSLTFHDLAKLSEHVKCLHAGLRFDSVENVKDGISTSNQINGGSFNLTIKLPESKMGPKDIHLTLIPNKMSSPHAPLVIEVCRQKGEEINMTHSVIEESLDSKCPFCAKHFSNSKYEKHLQESHHVASMMHPLLKIPAFKCIHCLGVYTDSMTTSTISLHLLHCRGLNKQQNNILPKSVIQSKREFPENAKKYGTELLSNGGGKDLALPPPKRIKANVIASSFEVSPVMLNDTANTSHSSPLPDPSTVLALVPKGFENRTYEERKLFLLDYFHKQPYPSNKEIEMLSSILWLWKSDVALVFGTKQNLCLKAMKYKPSVLLGFNMSELKKVKHNLKLGEI
uniref:activity-dependent neuroprotective protein 2a n=1 Tax=Pristiophorus japonicus TaxID=55135 RepID=UPI00398EBC68